MKKTEIKIIERLGYGDFIIERNTGEQFRVQLRFDIEDLYQAHKLKQNKMKNTITTKSQTKLFNKTTKKGELVRVKVRFDDQCGNGHNSFSITGEIYGRKRIPNETKAKNAQGKTVWLHSGGCIHNEIKKEFPRLAHLTRWHGFTSEGPLHYLENTMYHADQHAANKCWVYAIDPATKDERCAKYCSTDEGRGILKAYPEKGIEARMEIDPKTEKKANIEAARRCAVWPDANLVQLSDKEALKERLPLLMSDFRADIEKLGFTF